MPGGGYIRAYRAVFSNPIFKNKGEAMVFIYLVMEAAWAPMTVRYKGRLIDLQRGQLAISVRDLATAMDRSKGWVERFLEALRNRDMIGTVNETGVNVITICNYDKFQPISDDLGTATEKNRDRTGTQKKEDKELKEKKEDNPPTPLALPEWLPMEAWSGWLEVRKRMGVPNTDRALAMAIKKLDEFRRAGLDPKKLLEEAMVRGWRGIFAPGGQRGDDMRKQGALTL